MRGKQGAVRHIGFKIFPPPNACLASPAASKALSML